MVESDSHGCVPRQFTKSIPIHSVSLLLFVGKESLRIEESIQGRPRDLAAREPHESKQALVSVGLAPRETVRSLSRMRPESTSSTPSSRLAAKSFLPFLVGSSFSNRTTRGVDPNPSGSRRDRRPRIDLFLLDLPSFLPVDVNGINSDARRKRLEGPSGSEPNQFATVGFRMEGRDDVGNPSRRWTRQCDPRA